MRPPFTLLAGNRQSQSPNIVRSRRGKDDNNNSKEASSSSSTPSSRPQTIVNPCGSASAPAPSMFTRSSNVQEPDAFSSTAYILDDMMDIDNDNKQDNLLLAPAESVGNNNDNNNKIFAPDSRAKTPQSTRKALQVKTMGDHVELRIVEQEIRPEHVPLPLSSPLKQHSPVKRARRTSVAQRDDGQGIHADARTHAAFLLEDATEQAAAIPLPPSPEKPRTGVQQQDTSILESPTVHFMNGQDAIPASNGNDVDMLDDPGCAVPSHSRPLPPSSPCKKQEVEAAIQAEALLSPTQEHTLSFPCIDSGDISVQDADTTFDVARNVELPLSPEKAVHEEQAEGLSSHVDESMSAGEERCNASIENNMLDLPKDDSSSASNDDDENDDDDGEVHNGDKAAERAVFKAALDLMMHDSDSDQSEAEDEIDRDIKEKIFKILQEAREDVIPQLADSAPQEVAGHGVAESEDEEENEEEAFAKELCVAELSRNLFKKKEDRESFTEQMMELIDAEERIIRREERDEQDETRGLKSPIVQHVEAFPPAQDDDALAGTTSPAAGPAGVSVTPDRGSRNVDEDEEENAMLRLAMNTELPPSPGKALTQSEDQEDLEADDTSVPVQQEGIGSIKPADTEACSWGGGAQSPTPHILQPADCPLPAPEVVAQSPSQPTAIAIQATSTCTAPTSYHSSSLNHATPPPAARNQESSGEAAHLKAPTAAARQLAKSSKSATTTNTRGRGRPKGSGKRKDQVDASVARHTIQEELQDAQAIHQGENEEDEEKPARRSTRSKSTLSKSASKESLASIASTSTSTSAAKVSKRGAAGPSKRKRGGSVASQIENEAAFADVQAVKTEDTTMQLDEERAGQDIALEVLDEAPLILSAKMPPTTTAKRTSSRIATVSALPQPKAKRKACKPPIADSSSSSLSSSTNAPADEDASNKRRKTTAATTETSSDQLIASASCASATARETVLPVRRAIPQRTTRTASAAAASKGRAASTSSTAKTTDTKEPVTALRSPSRVVGSPKRSNTLSGTMQAGKGQQPKKTVPLFAQPSNHRTKDDHVPSPGPRTAARSPSRVLQAQNAAASPTKSAAVTSSTTHVAMRSPLRLPGAGGHFEWPKSSSSVSQKTEPGTARPVTGYSEETWMRARSKVFGDKIPAKHAGGPSSSATVNNLKSSTNVLKSSSSSSSTAPPIVSPIKTAVTQRMLAPPSPGLLNLSVTPESLLLVSATPSPALAPASSTAEQASQSTSFLTTSVPPPNVAVASSVFSGGQRAVSHPPQGVSEGAAKAPAPLASPRRALSVQPPPSPRRVDLPSPRRVMASSSISSSRPVPSPARVAAVFSGPSNGGTASKSSTPAASRLPTSKKACNQTAAEEGQSDQPPVVTPKTQSTSIATGRRSTRATRQQEKLPDNAAASILREKPAATARSAQARALPPVKSAPVMTAAQLAALTMKNTNNNKAHYNVHKVTTIYKDEDRPPSPTSKIRKIIEEPVVVASSSSTSVGTVSKASRAGSKRKAAEAGLAPEIDGGRAKFGSDPVTMTASGRKPHFKAAGDEDIFESPVKARKIDDEGRAVKWDRELLKEVQDIRTPRRATQNASLALSRKSFKLNYELDTNGNVADCKASLSPMVPRQQVPISKIIYRDDPDE